ncbi:uncharacterized protein LOC144157035 [Haemaphysalis longicornis]
MLSLVPSVMWVLRCLCAHVLQACQCFSAGTPDELREDYVYWRIRQKLHEDKGRDFISRALEYDEENEDLHNIQQVCDQQPSDAKPAWPQGRRRTWQKPTASQDTSNKAGPSWLKRAESRTPVEGISGDRIPRSGA